MNMPLKKVAKEVGYNVTVKRISELELKLKSPPIPGSHQNAVKNKMLLSEIITTHEKYHYLNAKYGVSLASSVRDKSYTHISYNLFKLKKDCKI